jgi:hypothetical protein
MVNSWLSTTEGQLRRTVERQDIHKRSASTPAYILILDRGLPDNSSLKTSHSSPRPGSNDIKIRNNKLSYLPPRTDSAWDAGAEESAFNADQEQDTYIDRSQDISVLQSRYTFCGTKPCY